MSPRKALKESKKRFRKKSHLLSQDDRDKIRKQMDDLSQAIADKKKPHARELAKQLRRKVAETMPKKPLEVILEYVVSFSLAIIIALTIRHFLIEPFKIPTGSMIPTFKPGDYILVSKSRYGPRIPFTSIKPFGKYYPKRWDIVVFTTKGLKNASQYPRNFVKRVIGLPGEKLEIRDGEIYKYVKNENGQEEPVLLEKPQHLKELVVPYGVVQPASSPLKGGYILAEPPGESVSSPRLNYTELDGEIKVENDRLTVNGQTVRVYPNLLGHDLPYSFEEDGKTVNLKGVYYFNTPDSARCAIETWDYWFNFMDLHLIRKKGTQGREFGDPYAAGYEGEPFVVPEGHYLMLGDNSGRSFDSRGWGFVPYGNIKGKVLMRWWPPRRWGIPD